jgi:hypothetical protein
MAGERFGLQFRFKVFEFAFGAAAFEMVAFQGSDAGGIVAAILKPLERVHQLFRDGAAPENADNAAHADQSLQIGEKPSKQRTHLLTRLADRLIVNNYCVVVQSSNFKDFPLLFWVSG